MAEPFLYDPVKVVITIVVAFLPAIIYTIIIRYMEKYERESWGSIGQAFLWGATLAIVLVILFRGFFRVYIDANYPRIASDEQYFTLILVCFFTPFAAELIKPIGLLFVRGDLDEAEDGLIYGAVIGLGYTATENLLFGMFLAPLYGIEVFITIIFMRSMSVMFIHSSTTALACYGITRAMKVKHKAGSFLASPLFLFAAIGIHATFNYIVFRGLFDMGNVLFNISSSLLFSIIFAFVLMAFIYGKIYSLDREDYEKKKEMQAKRSAASYDNPDYYDSRPRRGPEYRGYDDYYDDDYNEYPDRPIPQRRGSMHRQEMGYYNDSPGPPRAVRGHGARRGPMYTNPQQRPPGPRMSYPPPTQVPPVRIARPPRAPGQPPRQQRIQQPPPPPPVPAQHTPRSQYQRQPWDRAQQRPPAQVPEPGYPPTQRQARPTRPPRSKPFGTPVQGTAGPKEEIIHEDFKEPKTKPPDIKEAVGEPRSPSIVAGQRVKKRELEKKEADGIKKKAKKREEKFEIEDEEDEKDWEEDDEEEETEKSEESKDFEIDWED